MSVIPESQTGTCAGWQAVYPAITRFGCFKFEMLRQADHQLFQIELDGSNDFYMLLNMAYSADGKSCP
jgi:hypothetical protein